jgi:DNA primase
MIGSIPEEKIQLMRDGVDIVGLISRYVSLKRTGSNHVGLCPFHAEKTPSFSVSAGRQIFKCFGCGVGGDAFEFLMRIEGLNFVEAATRVAAEMGIDLEPRQLSPAQEQQREEKERLQKIAALASEFYHLQLLRDAEAEACRQYLNRRGYGRTSATEYQLGYAPRQGAALAEHLRRQGANLDDARRLGLIRPREHGEGDYDLFRGRLIFPIHDLSGRVVAFGGRILDAGQPKYINSPQSALYHKGQVLFGLHGARQAIRQAGAAILVEGYFDQLALVRAGFAQAIATCGTALTPEHAQLIKRYARRVLLLFDSDQAGRKATFKSMELLLPVGIEAAVVTLETGEDPDSFLLKHGREAFEARLAAARPVVEVYMDDCLAECAPGSAALAQATRRVLDVLKRVADPLEADLYLQELARRTGLQADMLRQQLQSVQIPLDASARGTQPAPRSEPAPQRQVKSREAEPAPAASAPRGRSGGLTPAEAKLIRLLIFEEEVRQQVASQGVENFFVDVALVQMASEILYQLQDVVAGQELTSLQRFPELYARLPQPLDYDPAEYADAGEQMLENYRQKAADRRRRALLKNNS